MIDHVVGNSFIHSINATRIFRISLYSGGFIYQHNLFYEGDPRSNANSCEISFTIAIFQDSLHQNYDALSIFPDPITILTESHSNPCCLATRECKVNDLGHGKNVFYLCNSVSYAKPITPIIVLFRSTLIP